MRSRAIRSSHKHQCAKLLQGPWHTSQGPSCSLYAVLLLLIGFLACLAAPAPSDAQQSDRDFYQRQLIGQAEQARLAEQREWHLLLHYRKNLFGGYESEQDDPGFFLSSKG